MVTGCIYCSPDMLQIKLLVNVKSTNMSPTVNCISINRYSWKCTEQEPIENRRKTLASKRYSVFDLTPEYLNTIPSFHKVQYQEVKHPNKLSFDEPQFLFNNYPKTESRDCSLLQTTAKYMAFVIHIWQKWDTYTYTLNICSLRTKLNNLTPTGHDIN